MALNSPSKLKMDLEQSQNPLRFKSHFRDLERQLPHNLDLFSAKSGTIGPNGKLGPV